MKLDRKEKQPPSKKLIDYLNMFGSANFRDLRMSDGTIDYATITFVTREELAEGLEEEISSRMTRQNGYRADLRFIALHDFENGKFKYAVEVVPHEEIPRAEWQEVTEDFLQKLRKVVKNYRHKNPSKQRGR